VIDKGSPHLAMINVIIIRVTAVPIHELWERVAEDEDIPGNCSVVAVVSTEVVLTPSRLCGFEAPSTM